MFQFDVMQKWRASVKAAELVLEPKLERANSELSYRGVFSGNLSLEESAHNAKATTKQRQQHCTTFAQISDSLLSLAYRTRGGRGRKGRGESKWNPSLGFARASRSRIRTRPISANEWNGARGYAKASTMAIAQMAKQLFETAPRLSLDLNFEFEQCARVVECERSARRADVN